MRLLIFTPVIVILAALDSGVCHAKDGATITSEDPRAVVSRWLKLYRTGKRAEASTLAAGARSHRAYAHLPSNRDMGCVLSGHWG